MMLRKRTLSTVLLGITALLATGTLSGCTFGGAADSTSGTPEAEHSHIDTAGAVAELPGISAAQISTSPEGTPNQVFLLARVSADAGFPADPADLLDYVLRQAWSTTEEKPTTTVRVDLTVEGQDLDLVALAGEIGLTGTIDAKNKYDSSVRIGVKNMMAAYGSWPGRVPSAPASLAGATR